MKKILLTLLALLPVLTFAANPSSITVMSFNIRYGDAKDGTNSWNYRYYTSAMMIEDQKPDVIGLQEALHYQVKYLDEFVDDYKYVGVGRDNGKQKGEYSAIMYNKKTVSLLKWGTFWLSETPEKPSKGWDAACTRTATWAILKDKKSGNKFIYVNTHLDHIGKEARKNGVSLILERIKTMNKQNLPVILGGDLNVDPGDPCLAEIETTMKSTRTTALKTDDSFTFNAWGKKDEVRLIDYLYYSGFDNCTVYEVIKKPYDDRKFISDHYPIKAVLVF